MIKKFKTNPEVSHPKANCEYSRLYSSSAFIDANVFHEIVLYTNCDVVDFAMCIFVFLFYYFIILLHVCECFASAYVYTSHA